MMKTMMMMVVKLMTIFEPPNFTFNHQRRARPPRLSPAPYAAVEKKQQQQQQQRGGWRRWIRNLHMSTGRRLWRGYIESLMCFRNERCLTYLCYWYAYYWYAIATSDVAHYWWLKMIFVSMIQYRVRLRVRATRFLRRLGRWHHFFAARIAKKQRCRWKRWSRTKDMSRDCCHCSRRCGVCWSVLSMFCCCYCW